MRRFVWDERKRLANLDKHGLDFEDVLEVEWETAAIGPARPDRFGRPRRKAIARFRGGTIAVIYADLGNEGVSIISFRRAKPAEGDALDGQRKPDH